jgi:hypothetical protein
MQKNIEEYRSGRSGRRSGGGGRSRNYSRSGSRSGGYRSNNRGARIFSSSSSSNKSTSSKSNSKGPSYSTKLSGSKYHPSFGVNSDNYHKNIPRYTQTSTSNTLGSIGGGGIANPYWGWEGEEHSWMYPIVVEPSEIISISEYDQLVRKKKEKLEKEIEKKKKELKKIEKFYKY